MAASDILKDHSHKLHNFISPENCHKVKIKKKITDFITRNPASYIPEFSF